jgi:hypothetical protein
MMFFCPTTGTPGNNGDDEDDPVTAVPSGQMDEVL